MLCFYKYYLLYNVYICMTELRLYIWRRKAVSCFFMHAKVHSNTRLTFLHEVEMQAETKVC